MNFLAEGGVIQFGVILRHIYFRNHVPRYALSVRLSPEVRSKSSIRQDIHTEIVVTSIAATQCLYEPLIQTSAHEARVTKIGVDKLFLNIDGPRQSCDDDQSTFIGFEIHSIERA